MTAIIINLLVFGALAASLIKSRQRTKRALQMAARRGLGLAPWMVGIIVMIGIVLALVPPPVIQQYLGAEMDITQVTVAALVGTVSMIPNLIAMPLAGSLVDSGASYTTIAAFITTLTMVGFVTFPLEMKELGRQITFWRNVLAFIFAVVIALLIGVFI